MLRFFSVVGIKLDFSGFEFGLTPSFLPASLRYAETGRRGRRIPRDEFSISAHQYFGHLEKLDKEQFVELYGEPKVSGIQKAPCKRGDST